MTTDVIGGVTVVDPARWLEDDADPAVQAWQAEQDVRTVKELAASPHLTAVRAALEPLFADVFTYAAPQRFGDTWFRLGPVVEGGPALLAVGPAADHCDRALLDPSTEGPGVTIAVWVPSPDGSKVVVGTTAGGPVWLRVLNVSTGEVLRTSGPGLSTVLFSWLPDGSGFFHQAFGTTIDASGASAPETEIWWQPVDSERVRQQVELDHPVGWPVVSADGRWVVVFADQTSPRPQWVRRTDGAWRRVLTDQKAMLKGTVVGDDLWALTDDTSGWCRLVAVPLETTDDRTTWRELLPAQPGTKLLSLTRCGDRVALATIREGAMQLVVLDAAGAVEGEVPLPSDGAFGKTGVGHLTANLGEVVTPDAEGCVFVLSALDRSPCVMRADLVTRTVEELVPSRTVLDDRVVEVRTTAVRDVQYRVFRKAATPLDGSAPVVVSGYGGFGVPWLPAWSSLAAAWTELGGVWVHAHLRGGGERDTDFFQAGRMHRKQGTFDDLFAVLEDLHATGVAVPEGTAVWGTSNGGLTVGAAVTQRPELLRAAVAQVPVLDLLQLRKDPGTVGIALADYGNPDDPADAPVLHAYSPYHRVVDGTAYPAVLLDAGAEDTSCPPWHSRKTAARLMEATTSGHRVLLRVRQGVGHNRMTEQQSLERDVEELVFLLDELA